MTAKAKAVQTLYRAGKINVAGVAKAVTSRLITVEEYLAITGKAYTT